MAERKTIGTISVITDSETSYDNIGDIDGGFSETELKKHIQSHGHSGLCEKLSAMSAQVWNMVREINSDVKHSAKSNSI